MERLENIYRGGIALSVQSSNGTLSPATLGHVRSRGQQTTLSPATLGRIASGLVANEQLFHLLL